MDGVFAFILLDELNNNIFVARDRFGVRPLFKQIIEEMTPEFGNNFYVYASELKVIKSLNYGYESQIKHFQMDFIVFKKNNRIIVFQKLIILSVILI